MGASLNNKTIRCYSFWTSVLLHALSLHPRLEVTPKVLVLKKCSKYKFNFSQEKAFLKISKLKQIDLINTHYIVLNIDININNNNNSNNNDNNNHNNENIIKTVFVRFGVGLLLNFVRGSRDYLCVFPKVHLHDVLFLQ